MESSLNLPTSVSQVLGLQVYNTMPGLWYILSGKKDAEHCELQDPIWTTEREGVL